MCPYRPTPPNPSPRSQTLLHRGVCVCVSRASSLKRRCRPYKGTLTSPELPKGGGHSFVRTGRQRSWMTLSLPSPRVGSTKEWRPKSGHAAAESMGVMLMNQGKHTIKWKINSRKPICDVIKPGYSAQVHPSPCSHHSRCCLCLCVNKPLLLWEWWRLTADHIWASSRAESCMNRQWDPRAPTLCPLLCERHAVHTLVTGAHALPLAP